MPRKPWGPRASFSPLGMAHGLLGALFWLSLPQHLPGVQGHWVTYGSFPGPQHGDGGSDYNMTMFVPSPPIL